MVEFLGPSCWYHCESTKQPLWVSDVKTVEAVTAMLEMPREMEADEVNAKARPSHLRDLFDFSVEAEGVFGVFSQKYSTPCN